MSQFKYSLYVCFFDVNLLIKRNFACVNVKCYQQTAGVLRRPKLPRKKDLFGLVLLDGKCFMQFN